MVTNPAALRPFAPAFYGVGTIMGLIAIGDWAGNTWPWRISDFSWRYMSLGIFSNFLVTTIFALILVSAGAAIARHRTSLQVFGVIGIGGAALLLVGAALFSLDAVQFRQGAPADARWLTTVSAAIAVAKYVAAAIVLFVTGAGGLRGARALAGTKGERAGLVVGAS